MADDDKETVKLFSELLQSNGIKVVGKGFNGHDAVFLYQKLKPDVVYLDVTMPVFDGIYALEKIRELNLDAVIIMLADNITLNNIGYMAITLSIPNCKRSINCSTVYIWGCSVNCIT